MFCDHRTGIARAPWILAASVLLVLSMALSAAAQTTAEVRLVPTLTPGTSSTSTDPGPSSLTLDLGLDEVGVVALEIWASDIGTEVTGLVGAFFDVRWELSDLASATALNHGSVFTDYAPYAFERGTIDNPSDPQVTNFGGVAFDGNFPGPGQSPDFSLVGWIMLNTHATLEGTVNFEVSVGPARMSGIGQTMAEAAVAVNGATVQINRGARVSTAVPPDQTSLWRTEHNIIRLRFDGDITVPTAGEIKIQQMLDDGLYGADLSTNFSFDQTNSNGVFEANLLTIRETTPCLTHRTWVAVRCTGACWSGVLEFLVQYMVLVGDVDNSGRVLSGDASNVYAKVSFDLVNDDVREDVDGSGRVLSGDASSIYPNISFSPLPKPSGH